MHRAHSPRHLILKKTARNFDQCVFLNLLYLTKGMCVIIVVSVTEYHTSASVWCDGILFINLVLSVDHMYYSECLSDHLSDHIN